MLQQLQLLNFPPQAQVVLPSDWDCFVLKTCQRHLVLTLSQDKSIAAQLSPSDFYRGEEAYQFLLEIICGLQSQLLGENEIVHQFKQSYAEYLEQRETNSAISPIIEKLLMDAKKIRTAYLSGIGQKTYAALTRKKVLHHGPVDKILIMGSGNLAIDLINQFKKRADIYLTARNQEKVKAIADEHGIETAPWLCYQTYSEFSHIANGIGTNQKLLCPEFFNLWHERQRNNQSVFVDLGEPSCIHTPLTLKHGIYRLKDLFEEGAIQDQSKREKIDLSRTAMRKMAKKRSDYFHNRLLKKQNYINDNSRFL